MIRKIVVGSDYTNGMCYTVGQRFGKNTIHAIKYSTKEEMKKIGCEPVECFAVYIKNQQNEITVWKQFFNINQANVEHFIDNF